MPIANHGIHDPLLETGTSTVAEFDILDLLLVLAARKRIILLSTLACMVLTGVVVLVLRPTFTATALILPPEQEQSGAAALLGQVGALASIAGMGGGSMGLKNPNDLYIGILKSETIADALVKQFDLMHSYHARSPSGARRMLARRSKFLSEKDDLISIAVEDHNPRRAAAMANAYVEQLHDMNTHLAFTQASQRRIFYEQQLAEEKDRLADAEVALKQTEDATGVIAPAGQLETTIRQIAQVQAEITAHEVELDALRTSSTEQNPDVIRLTTELVSLRQQEHDLETSTKGKHIPGDIAISSAAAPQVGLEYIRKERDIKYHQLLFDLIARQYEAARIDEAKSAPVIQVVDPALVPERKSGPHRTLWTLLGGFLGFFFSSAWVLALRAYHKVEADPEQGGKLIALRQTLAWRSRS